MNQDISLEASFVRRCIQARCTVATAESCTGGLISHRITNVPGASAVFLGGITAYANTIKTVLLGVPETLLADVGAVSESVALAMAVGARARFGSDVAVSVTGIAGPGGGTREKPVGTVYLAVVSPEIQRTRHAVFSGNRDMVKAQTADAAFSLLLEIMEGNGDER